MEKKAIKRNFPVTGMSCASCAARVEKVLGSCDGVLAADVNLATSTANVEYVPGICSPEQLQRAVRDAGYDLLPDESIDELQNEQAANYRTLRRQMLWAVILSLPVAVTGMFFMNMPYAKLIMFLFATPVVFVFGRRFFVGAWRQLRHKTANMDTLVALSTGIAWLFSVANMLFPSYWESKGIHPHVYFEASAVIIAFILLGRTLESKAKSNTSTSIKKLMGLRPTTVMIVGVDGVARERPIGELNAGDTVAVRPGERIAVDGTVSEGTSYVDESMLSGEPVPVAKEKGSKVYAGTINGTGTFRFVAEKVGDNTLLSKIIRMVQDAQGSKAPVQHLVDKVAAVFVPTIMAIAIISFIVWMIADGRGGFSHGLLAAVTVLIIACPCALGLATPTAIMVGIGKGAESGILIKDAESLEIAPKIDAVVLDKTGTITEGRPTVERIEYFRTDKYAESVLLALEESSEHPLARAVTEHLGELPRASVTGFESVTGRGVKGVAMGKTYFVGNRRMMEENNVPLTEAVLTAARGMTADANSLVWFADSCGVIALIGISDPVKPTSPEAVSELERMGIEVYMLTGDNQSTAEAVARRAGISHVYAEMLPQDKSAFVQQLQSQGKRVAMAGDGINDSAALAMADLSIAMGTGSDIAIEVAQMTVISADLAKIPTAFRLAGQTVRTIHQNLFWAFVYNVTGVPIAAGILYPVCGFLLNPMIAGAAMAFSSVSVVCNSLLLKRKRLGPAMQPRQQYPHQSHKPERPQESNRHKHPENMTQTFKVDGMACTHCSSRVETVLKALPGAEKVNVDLAAGTATVEGPVDPSAVAAAVKAAGYDATPL